MTLRFEWQNGTDDAIAAIRGAVESAGGSIEDRLDVVNRLRREIHKLSPMKDHPVDFVEWVPAESVVANDYNPNTVAPPEMELLRVSVAADGYTQPIVTNVEGEHREVVDGFHRNRVGRECAEVVRTLHGYLPVVQIRASAAGRGDRIASTIRHNRARGKHAVVAMSDIVVELKRRNWTDERISRELGMDKDEILRLCQITGLSELFSDQEFSEAWDVEGSVAPEDFVELTDDVDTYGDEVEAFRTANTSDGQRVFHTYDQWECYRAGFYATTVDGMTKSDCEMALRDLLRDVPAFKKALEGVITEWPKSCEHYLTNLAMNRLAWLGQAATCYAVGVPAGLSRGGFSLLTEREQQTANSAALDALNRWAEFTGREAVTLDEAAPDREVDIY